MKSDTSIRESMSIRESIQLGNIEESKHDDRSDITEDIIEGSQISERDPSDEIKESMHPEEDSHLSNVRRVFGNEKVIREQSKKIISSPNSMGKGTNNGMFDKNSFGRFIEDKYKDFLTEENQKYFDLIDK